MELSEFIKNPVYQYPNIHINAKMDKVLGFHLNPLSVAKTEYLVYARERYRPIGKLAHYYSKASRRL